MQRLLLLLITGVLSFTLAACGGTDSSDSNKDTGDKQTETQDKTDKKDKKQEKLGIGDTAEVGGVAFTLKSVTTTDERNEFADEEPEMVVKIEYELENNTDDEIPIGMDLAVYDGTGNKMDSYPLDNTLGSLDPGKKIQGTEHYGIGEGPIEIQFQPTLSFDKKAVFEAEVK